MHGSENAWHLIQPVASKEDILTMSPSLATYKKYVAEGLCGLCGKKPQQSEDSTLCQKCLKKHNALTLSTKQKNIENGLCADCGVEPLLTKRLGQKCRDRANANRRKK